MKLLTWCLNCEEPFRFNTNNVSIGDSMTCPHCELENDYTEDTLVAKWKQYKRGIELDVMVEMFSGFYSGSGSNSRRDISRSFDGIERFCDVAGSASVLGLDRALDTVTDYFM